VERNLRIPKDLLKTKWLQEIKEEKPVKNHISKSLEWQVKSKKYYKKKSTLYYQKYIKNNITKKKITVGKSSINELLKTTYQMS